MVQGASCLHVDQQQVIPKFMPKGDISNMKKFMPHMLVSFKRDMKAAFMAPMLSLTFAILDSVAYLCK